MIWSADDIAIVVEDDLTDDPVVTARISTPAGQLLVMAAIDVRGGELLLDGLHIEGVGIGPNDLGWEHLSQLARAVMERMGFDAIVVTGAVRTSGAHPGRHPRTLRFTRPIPAPR